jgi:hypothetical protein
LQLNVNDNETKLNCLHIILYKKIFTAKIKKT